jgi:uncharacterized protein YyaL (SSP411 family)
MPNRLAHASSPYLRQHADNPVDWYEWGPDAFDRARREDKPIFLSVGYSSCHWCHVMAHESFEDEEVAGVLNDRFVAVKVDREERPDVDSVYMGAVQALSGHGGWPMSVFLTPDGAPFFGGTYWPKDPRQGMPGFRGVEGSATRCSAPASASPSTCGKPMTSAPATRWTRIWRGGPRRSASRRGIPASAASGGPRSSPRR